MRRRTRNLLLTIVIVVVLAALGIVVYLRKRGPSEAVRLLPESDAVFYINFRNIRRLTAWKGTPVTPQRDPDYDEFVRETGFQFERDLNEAAFAATPAYSTNPAAPQVRFSEVFIGKFNTQKVAAYFRQHASGVEHYRDVEIFSLPLEGRTVRVALVGLGTAAASNTDGVAVIHGIIDRYKEAARPLSGPTVVHDYYKRLPLGTLVWAISRSGSPAISSLPVVSGISVGLPKDAVLVASVRFTGSVQARADLITPSPEQAQRLTEQANAYLAIFKAAETSVGTNGPDPDVKAAFESIKAEQEGNVARVSASIPIGFLEKVVGESPIEIGPDVQVSPQNVKPEHPAPAPSTKPKNR